MELRRVNPRSIKVPEVRVTAYFDEETRATFEKSVKEWGIETPILCFAIDSDLVLVDGKNRLEEALRNGEKLVDVVVRPGDMVEVMTRNIFLDHLRGKHKVTDMIRVFKSLHEDYGLGTDQISDQTLKNRDYIEKLLKIATASSEVLEALDQGAIGVGIAFELARLPQPIMQEEVLNKSTVYRLQVKDVKELVDTTLVEIGKLEAAVPPVAPTGPRPAAVYHCEGCKEQLDSRYLRPAMLCPNCFGAVWRLGKARETPEAEKDEVTGGD